MKPGDLVRVKLEAFVGTDHPFYNVPGMLVDIPETRIPGLPEEYRLWGVLIGDELTKIQGIDLELLSDSD